MMKIQNNYKRLYEKDQQNINYFKKFYRENLEK